jgi:hypothetical protein
MSALIGSYEPHDHRELARLMLRAIEDASRWKQAQPPPPDFADKFSPAAIVGGYLALYAAKGTQNNLDARQ